MTRSAHEKRQAIIDFLRSFKTALDFSWFHLKDRRKNLQGLADLGLSIDGMKEILSQLGVDNYAAGPEPEHDAPDKEVWVFGYELEGKEIYIKLRLAPDDPKHKDRYRAVVWSFHEAKHELSYPYKAE